MATTEARETLTDPKQGDEAPELVYGPVTRTDLVRYAGAGGDFNPIHHDDEFARQAGMPGVFAMGFFHAGVLADHVAGWLGLDRLRRYEVRFTGQVWPGDTLTMTGVVDRVYEQEGERLVDCSFEVRRTPDEVVTSATATARID